VDWENEPKSFRLILRWPQDVRILARPAWWNLRRLGWVLAGVGIAGVLALAWSLLLAKKNACCASTSGERERAEAELQRAHRRVTAGQRRPRARRVAARTVELREQIAAKDKAHAELAAAQKDLIEASRQAGMAEVATGVLHNVGNVVNSINVSATLIREEVGSIRILKFAQVKRSAPGA